MGIFKTAVRTWLGLNTNPEVKGIEQQDAPDIEAVNKPRSLQTDLLERWVWYTGNAQRLIGFYQTQMGVTGKKDYFWCRSAYETNKKTHSGLPRAIVDAICNTTGIPTAEVGIEGVDKLEEKTQEEYNKRLDEIIAFNDFENIVKQDMRAKTLVIGGGVLFVSVITDADSDLTKPVFEFIDERRCDIETIGNIFKAATKKTTYQTKDKEYTLYERRTKTKFTYRLVDDKGIDVPLNTLKETEHLKPEIANPIDEITAIPVRYKNGINGTYGLSIFEGKIDLFDDLDQAMSQISEIVRKSTIINYASSDLFETDKNGNAIAPDEFDVRFIKLKGTNKQDDKPLMESIQPTINYAGLLDVKTQLVIDILTAILSPSTLGIEVQRNNNAEAMREKEKVTLVTRDDIIDNETFIIQKALRIAMKLYDYMDGKKPLEYDIHVDYPDFTSPTFEQLVATMLPLWAADAISPEQFVKTVHGDTLTEEDKLKEIAYLTEKKSSVMDPSFFGDLSGLETKLNQQPETKPIAKDGSDVNVQ